MTGIVIGLLLGTIGLTLIESFNEIIACLVELFKAKISVKIMKCNSIIQELSNSQGEEKIHAIGFATNFEEDDEDDE